MPHRTKDTITMPVAYKMKPDGTIESVSYDQFYIDPVKKFRKYRIRVFLHAIVKAINRLSGYKIWAKGTVPEVEIWTIQT